MRRPLFVKIFLGVCACFVFMTFFVWFADSMLNVMPSRTATVNARMALAAADFAVRQGGEPALRRQLADWPAIERDHISVYPIAADVVPAQDQYRGLFAISAVDPKGQRFAIIYQVSRFSGNVSPPLAFDMGPRILSSAVVGVFIFSALLTVYLTVPIRRLRAAFARLSAGDLKSRLGPQSLRRRDEIADLAADFNKMAARLEELVASRDRLLADMSHELRSPLARLQLAIALARQSPEKAAQSLQRVGREADKLEEMVGEILALSKLESGVRTADEYFFVSEVARMVVDDARFEAQEKGVEIDLVLGAGREAMMHGSGKLISRAIENVVRNALRFSRKGDRVTVELESNAAGTNLLIRDHGPGVEADQLQLLFEPFVQVGTNHGQGYGLGLAIAKRAVIAHGGAIKAARNPDGGLAITIWLPAAADAPESGEPSVRDRSISPAPV
jgi:two-component system, OmpR family, sensor kinase